MVDFMDERMLPADNVPLRPPILPPGMIRLADENIGETLCFARLTAFPVDFQFVEAFQVETNAALFGVDLERIEILAARCEACGFQRAERAILELDRGNKRIVY